MKKSFLAWDKIKQRLDIQNTKPPQFYEREVWWVYVGLNVGTEIDGKSHLYTRPVLIFKKLSTNGFIGIPFSTKTKDGSWYIRIFLNNTLSTALLSQVSYYDTKRLSNKLGRIGRSQYKLVRESVYRLLFI